MSSCLSGGGRTYGFDFDFIKSSSSWTRNSNTSSPSSTISESSNSPLAISTRKPRAPRKRPNQTYNEAAALLSTAYPNLFSAKNLKKPARFTRPADPLFDDSSELLFPCRFFDSSSSLLQSQIQHKPSFPLEPKVFNPQEKTCQSPGEISSRVKSLELDDDCQEDFDAESILDEEIGEGIDSIMGSKAEDSNGGSCHIEQANPWMSWASARSDFGGKLDFRLGLRGTGVRALRHVDDGNWWNLRAVDISKISPRISKPPTALVPTPMTTTTTKTEKKKQKKKKVEKLNNVELKNSELPEENPVPKSNPGLQLKLNYEEVRDAWSDRGSPFADESPASASFGNDVKARLSQIDLLLDGGEGREASLLRYKEKRRTRLFSKKIRYQVRKVNADQRPRMKGRFVRKAKSSSNAQR